MENSRLRSRPIRSLIADRDSDKKKDEHHKHCQRHGEEDTRPPVRPFNLARQEAPDMSSGVTCVEENQNRGKHSENEIDGDGSAWKEGQKTGREQAQDQE